MEKKSDGGQVDWWTGQTANDIGPVVTSALPTTSATDIVSGMSAKENAAQTPLTPAVLHILLALAEGERHGYAIAQEIETATEGDIHMGPGTLYGSIRRMLSAGLIDESPRRRRPDDDERRRYYRMTPQGRRLLEAELSRLTRVVRVARGKRILRDPGVA